MWLLLFCSIGSLGGGNTEAQVSNVEVNRATLIGTTNGVRIKTWQVNLWLFSTLEFCNILIN